MNNSTVEQLKYFSKEPLWIKVLWHVFFLGVLFYMAKSNPVIQTIEQNGEEYLLLNKNFISLSVVLTIYVTMTIYWKLWFAFHRKLYEVTRSMQDDSNQEKP